MGAGAFLEPLVVVTLLLGGTWINRESDVTRSYSYSPLTSTDGGSGSDDDEEETPAAAAAPPKLQHDPVVSSSRAHSPSLLAEQEDPWRKRALGFGPWQWRTVVRTPNTTVFRNRVISRSLRRFPFLVECWYWLLVYWVRLLFSLHLPFLEDKQTVLLADKQPVINE